MGFVLTEEIENRASRLEHLGQSVVVDRFVFAKGEVQIRHQTKIGEILSTTGENRWPPHEPGWCVDDVLCLVLFRPFARYVGNLPDDVLVRFVRGFESLLVPDLVVVAVGERLHANRWFVSGIHARSLPNLVLPEMPTPGIAVSAVRQSSVDQVDFVDVERARWRSVAGGAAEGLAESPIFRGVVLNGMRFPPLKSANWQNPPASCTGRFYLQPRRCIRPPRMSVSAGRSPPLQMRWARLTKIMKD